MLEPQLHNGVCKKKSLFCRNNEIPLKHYFLHLRYIGFSAQTIFGELFLGGPLRMLTIYNGSQQIELIRCQTTCLLHK